MRAIRIGLVIVPLAAAVGCGTTWNTFGPRQYPHVYGGVELDCMAMQGTWSNAKAPVAEKVLLTSLIAVDVPLCVVGDTLTLPNLFLQSPSQNSGGNSGKDN